MTATRPSSASVPPAGAGRDAPRSRASLGAAILVLCAGVALAGCGDDFEFRGKKGKASPLAAVYDVLVSVPDLEFGMLGRTGLRMALEITVDSVAPSGDVDGSVLVREVLVGGQPESFAPSAPLAAGGRLRQDALDILPFGPLTIGGQDLFLELVGLVSPDGREWAGLARPANVAVEGTFSGVKQRSYLVATSNFGLQGFATVVIVRFGGTMNVVFELRRDVEIISGDAVAASSGELPLIVNRLSFDNVQVLDRQQGFLTALQFSTGNGSNPHDALEVPPGRLYVTRYAPGFDDILVADPGTGNTLGTIPLGQLGTNSSGTARPHRMVRAGGLVLVTLQNIDATFQDYGPGLLAFIDPNTSGLVASLTLAGQNPFGPPAVHPLTGEVYLAEAGIFPGLLPRSLSGGIEVIDPATLSSRGLLVDDDDAGGNISGVAVAGAREGFMVVVNATGTNSLVAFDPNSGLIGPTLLTTPALIPEIRYDGDGYLLVAEHDVSRPGLRVLDPNTGAQVVRLPLSLPPVSVAILTRGLRTK